MAVNNNVLRIRTLIDEIHRADEAYYRDDSPYLSDREYDALMAELAELEKTTGIIFANSPTQRVGGAGKVDLKKVPHSKPMLSAKKTKSKEDILSFAAGQKVLLSWKLDGLTIVIRYRNGAFAQALTRGEEGLVGEDITHTVKYLRNVPMKVDCSDPFEVRGEGVISWADFALLNRNRDHGHPRNTAAAAVRALAPDKGMLSHMDFFAFELIYPNDKSRTKSEQLEFMSLNRFSVVEYRPVDPCAKETAFKNAIDSFQPETYAYPADGIIAEYEDLDFGRGLGTTAHHENRMIALKWQDDTYETIFRSVEMSVPKNGQITLAAEFDPVMIDGTVVQRADLHSLAGFEKLKLGTGDKIRVYKANRIIPKIAENLTQSGTYRLSEMCPCCGSRLVTEISAGGNKLLRCPNEECIARNAQKLARFCDKDAMNIEGFTASVLEKLMAYGIVKTFTDLYGLEKQKEKILGIPDLGYRSYDSMVSSVENSRCCHLSQFLTAVGIPLMASAAARAIDEYFLGSWEAFEKAIKEGFCFFHIAGVSQALSRNIYRWYSDEAEAAIWRPVLKEISFFGQPRQVGEEGNPFANACVAVTGCVNGMNRSEITELLMLLGANVSDSVTKATNFLIVGEKPGTKKLSAALEHKTVIITEGHFAKMLAECSVEDDEAEDGPAEMAEMSLTSGER